MYRYKIYFKDGTNKISTCRPKKPTSLLKDFDELIDYNKYYPIISKNTSIKKSLELAFKCYKKLYKKNTIEFKSSTMKLWD